MLLFLWRREKQLDREQNPHHLGRKPMPIIVGSPRSGTTLLRLMLDSHKELAIPPETSFLKLGANMRGSGDRLREKFFQAIVSYPKPVTSWPDFGITEADFRAALAEVEPFTAAEGFRTFYKLYAARFGKTRWGDKTPLYCMEIDSIRRVLPEGRFIHIIRDGRDAALSLREMWFSPGPDIKTQAAFWRKCVTTARRAGTGRSDYFEVRYEDLILDTRSTLERVCKFVGLGFDEAMLSYYERAPERLKEHKGRWRPDGTALLTQEQRLRQQRRAIKPPDPECVFAWKRSMSVKERAAFQRVAGDLLEELGYEV
ncbi:MAG TPA: sulfotransferase [Pyrinomonadaceae bacterium]|nr:sulfotransferase [Pyrinomonadaceae bacterium]